MTKDLGDVSNTRIEEFIKIKKFTLHCQNKSCDKILMKTTRTSTKLIRDSEKKSNIFRKPTIFFILWHLFWQSGQWFYLRLPKCCWYHTATISHYPQFQDHFPSTHPIYQLPHHAVPGLGLRVACSIFPISHNGQFVPYAHVLRNFWCQVYAVALIAIIPFQLHIIPLVHYIWSFLLTKSDEVQLAFRPTSQNTHTHKITD